MEIEILSTQVAPVVSLGRRIHSPEECDEMRNCDVTL